VAIEVAALSLSIHQRSLRDLVAMHRWYSHVEHWQELLPWRPADSRQPGSQFSAAERDPGWPRRWWAYAITSTLHNLPCASWRRTLIFIRQGCEYGNIFKRQYWKGRPWLSPPTDAEVERLTELERILPLWTCKIRRQDVWHQLCQDEQGKEARIRDLLEQEQQLLKECSAESWREGEHEGQGKGRPHTVYYSGWVSFEGKKSMKNRWLVLADACWMDCTRFSGWLTMTGPKVKEQRLWFRLCGTTLTYYSTAEAKHQSLRGEIEVSSMRGLEVDDEGGSPPRQSTSTLRQSTAGSPRTPRTPRSPGQTVDPESFRLTSALSVHRCHSFSAVCNFVD
jgi:hypothetical protein